MLASPSRRRSVRLGARTLGGVAVGAALLLSGCGGDSGGGASSAPTSASTTSRPATTATTAGALTHAQLVAQADAACATAATAIAKVAPARSLSGLAQYAAQVQRIGTRLRGELAGLTPSVEDAPAFAKYLDGLETSNTALGEMGSAAQNGDADGVRAAAATIDGTAVGVLATRAGLPGCAATTPDGAGS